MNQRVIFPLGNEFICQASGALEFKTISKDSIINSDPKFNISDIIIGIFSSSDPNTFEPGCVVCLNTGKKLFYSYYTKNTPLIQINLEYTTLLDTYVIFQNFLQLIIINNTLFYKKYDESVIEIRADLPDDAFFICNSSDQALLVSRSQPMLLNIEFDSLNEINIHELPGGFSVSMECATIVDNATIAFSTSDGKLNLYTSNEDLKSVQIDAPLQEIEPADLESFEKVFVCLTVDGDLLYVRFDSCTATKVGKNIRDFCIIHTPFDQVVALTMSNEYRIIKPSKEGRLEPSILSMIDALNSRVASGLCSLSAARERMTLRNSLAEERDDALPEMVTLFGTSPSDSESEIKEETPKDNIWIEDASFSAYSASFVVKTNGQFSADAEVIISSPSAAFSAVAETECIAHNALRVNLQIVIESMSTLSPFTVFIRSGNGCTSAGHLDVPVDFLLRPRELIRIDRRYTVTFPGRSQPSSAALAFARSQTALNAEAIDNGASIRVTADNCERFEHRIISASAALPEGATFTPLDDSGERAAVALRSNIAPFVCESRSSVPKQELLNLKARIGDIQAHIYS